MGKFLGDVHALDLADEDLGVLGHVHTSQLGDGVGRLTDDLGVESAVDENGLADLFDFVVLQEIAAAVCELVFDLRRRPCPAR